jgi:hypothetical protein
MSTRALQGELAAAEQMYSNAEGIDQNTAASCRAQLAIGRILLNIAESLETLADELVQIRMLKAERR